MTEDEQKDFAILFLAGFALAALGGVAILAVKLGEAEEKNRIYRTKISGLINAFSKFVDHTVAVDDQDKMLKDMQDEFDIANRFIREGL